MSSLVLKLLNAPQRIEEVGLGKYMAKVLKHFGVAPNTRYMFVKTVKSLISPVIFVRSRFIGQFLAKKPKNLSISRETHVLRVPAHTISGLSELIDSVNQFYHARRNKIHSGSKGTYAYLISVLRKNEDTLDKKERRLLAQILRFASQPTLMGLASEYIGMVPVFHGYSLTKTSVVPKNQPYQGSQLFHRDVGEKKLLHLLVSISNVTQGDGPFTYIDAVASGKVMKKLGHQAGRVSDEVVLNEVSQDQIHEVLGDAGHVVFISPEKCFHYGARNITGSRIQLIITYAPPNEAVEGGTCLYLPKYKKEIDLSALSLSEKRLLKIY
jgi:hypothetical protein